MDNEKWLVVPWAARYKVSDHGRVMSLCGKSPRVIRGRVDRNGYLSVFLCGEERRVNARVHRLVLLVHRPNRLHKSLEVNHVDGNKQNNRADNLEWVKRASNIRHRYRTLGQKAPAGMDNHRTRHDDSVVLEARRLRSEGVRVCDIARKLQVGQAWVSKVCSGKIRATAQASPSDRDAPPSA